LPVEISSDARDAGVPFLRSRVAHGVGPDRRVPRFSAGPARRSGLRVARSAVGPQGHLRRRPPVSIPGSRLHGDTTHDTCQDPEVASREVCFPCNVCRPRCARPGLPATGPSRFGVGALPVTAPTAYAPVRPRPCGFYSRRRAGACHPGLFDRDVFGVAPRVIRARVLQYDSSCAVTDPPPGIFAAWPSCHSRTLADARQRSWGSTRGRPFAALLRPAGVKPLSRSCAHVPLSPAPPATIAMFAIVVADPSLRFTPPTGSGRELLRLLGFNPAEKPSRSTGATLPRRSNEGPHQLLGLLLPWACSSFRY
jgi:hypothetical protein